MGGTVTVDVERLDDLPGSGRDARPTLADVKVGDHVAVVGTDASGTVSASKVAIGPPGGPGGPPGGKGPDCQVAHRRWPLRHRRLGRHQHFTLTIDGWRRGDRRRQLIDHVLEFGKTVCVHRRRGGRHPRGRVRHGYRDTVTATKVGIGPTELRWPGGSGRGDPLHRPASSGRPPRATRPRPASRRPCPLTEVPARLSSPEETQSASLHRFPGQTAPVRSPPPARPTCRPGPDGTRHALPRPRAGSVALAVRESTGPAPGSTSARRWGSVVGMLHACTLTVDLRIPPVTRSRRSGPSCGTSSRRPCPIRGGCRRGRSPGPVATDRARLRRRVGDARVRSTPISTRWSGSSGPTPELEVVLMERSWLETTAE